MAQPARPPARAEEDRVRPCLECGNLLPFDAEICSLCGDRAAARDDEAVKPCLACGAVIGANQLFCPECGDFTLSIAAGEASIPPLGEREGRAIRMVAHVLAFGVLAAAAALLVMSVLNWVLVRAAAGD